LNEVLLAVHDELDTIRKQHDAAIEAFEEGAEYNRTKAKKHFDERIATRRREAQMRLNAGPPYDLHEMEQLFKEEDDLEASLRKTEGTLYVNLTSTFFTRVFQHIKTGEDVISLQQTLEDKDKQLRIEELEAAKVFKEKLLLLREEKMMQLAKKLDEKKKEMLAAMKYQSGNSSGNVNFLKLELDEKLQLEEEIAIEKKRLMLENQLALQTKMKKLREVEDAALVEAVVFAQSTELKMIEELERLKVEHKNQEDLIVAENKRLYIQQREKLQERLSEKKQKRLGEFLKKKDDAVMFSDADRIAEEEAILQEERLELSHFEEVKDAEIEEESRRRKEKELFEEQELGIYLTRKAVFEAEGAEAKKRMLLTATASRKQARKEL
jgi:hypothetical protein